MNMVPNSVAIGFVHGEHLHARFVTSLITIIQHHHYMVIDVSSSPNLSRGRNMVVDKFLETRHEWLFMVDTDTVFRRDTISALLGRDKDIISGLIQINNTPKNPSMFNRLHDDPAGTPVYYSITDYPPGECIQVDAVGASCLLAHRSVYEDIAQELPNKAAQWFQEVQQGNELVGEDITFCQRALKIGYEIYVDTAVPVGHIKTHII